MKQLTIIIKSDSRRNSFKSAIRESLSEFLESADNELKSKLQIIVSLERIDEQIHLNCEEVDTGSVCQYTSHDKLKDLVNGKYTVMLCQGDKPKLSCMNRFFQEAEKSGSSVFVCSDGLQEGDPVMDPRGVIIATELISSFKDLMQANIRTIGVLTKAILQASGYRRIGYEPVYIDHNQSETYDYTLSEDVLDDMIRFGKETSEQGRKYVQAVLTSLFHQQIRQNRSSALVRRYISYVSDQVLFDSDLPLEDRICLLELKYARPILEECRITDDKKVFWQEHFLMKLDKQIFKIIICTIQEGRILFQGLSQLHRLGEKCVFYVLTDQNEKYYPVVSDYPAVEKKGLDGKAYICPKQISVEVPLREGLRIQFVLENESGKRWTLWPKLGKFSRVVNNVKSSYFHDQDHIVRYQGGMFYVERYSRRKHLRYESVFLKEMIRKKKYAIAICRILYYCDRIFQRRPVWLVADRAYIAGDNGEHMFRFLQSTDAVHEKDIFFVLQEDSPDYARLRKIGKVLKYGSLKHKIKYLESEMILGSTYNELMTNVFGKTGIFFRDLRRFHFVFLRHGVSHNDQSTWLNKLRLNIRLLVTTCRPEYNGILKGDYAYTEREVKLTGLPRFDNLYDERKKLIAILPTWRRQLQGEIDSRTLKRMYVPQFRDSDYFIFYQSLIHDDRLLEAMERYDYRGVFYLHPVFEQQYKDFTDSRRIVIGKGVADYQKVFRESGIMVTDYSSVGFDFVYMKKPIIYSQFDEDSFFQKHSYGEGYFSYREDGFGRITNTVTETVDELIYYMKNDCQMRPEYIKRVDDFFAFTDRNNCRRVYEEICKLENP